MTAFVRIFFLIPVGFIVAVLAASLVLVVGSVGVHSNEEWTRFAVIGITFFLSIFVGGFVILPMGLVILLAEGRRWRSILFWLALGGALGVAGWLMPFENGSSGLDPYVTVYLAAGFAGGFIYWLIAGRNAGAGFGRAPTGSG